jgi:hypothetical protein
MGAHGGGGYTGPASSFTLLKDNIFKLAQKYPLDSENRFGTKVSEKTSEIYTDTPKPTAHEFWKALSKGARVREIQTKNGPGWIAEFSDKSHVVWRPVTTSAAKTGTDNPGVDIDVKTSGHGFPPRYRIHFKKGGKK